MAKKRATQHSGRTNKQGQAYSSKHNDRSFDTEAENIISELTPNNITWHCYQSSYPNMTFEEAEQTFYAYKFGEVLEQSNEKYIRSGHKERVKTMDEWRTSKMHCPEEVIIQVGKLDDTIDADTFKLCVDDYIRKMHEYCGSAMQILDYAIHVDEAVPHAHIRRVWIADKDGVATTGQEQALKSIGVKLPNEAEAPGRKNNRKMTFDADMREAWLDIIEARGIEVDRVPVPNAPHNRTKSKLIRDENKRLFEENLQMSKDIDVKLQELSDTSQKLSEAHTELKEVQGVSQSLKAQQNVLERQIEGAERELAEVRGDYIKQSDIRGRAEEKDLFGKGKGYVKVPLDEYMQLQRFSLVSDDVLEADTRLKLELKEVEGIKSTLKAEKSKIGQIRASVEQEKAEVEDMKANAPQYKLDAEKYHRWWSEELSKKSVLEEKLNQVGQECDKALNDLEAERELTHTQARQIKEKDKELSLLKKVFAPFIRVIDKIKELLNLEEVLREPDGELSRKNREKSQLYKWNQAPKPYAEWSSLNNRWQYYWQGGNSDRKGCLRKAYMPLAKELQDEIGTVAMLDQSLIQEGNEAIRSYQQYHNLDRGGR